MHPKTFIFFIIFGFFSPGLTFSNDVQTVLDEMHQIVKEELNNVFETFRNITKNFTSTIPTMKSQAFRAIIDKSEENLKKYTAIKESAEEAGVDIELCLVAFEFEDSEVILSGLKECIEGKTEDIINVIFKQHKQMVKHLLEALYSIQEDLAECEESDESCIEIIIDNVQNFNAVKSEQMQIRLNSAKQQILVKLQEVDLCTQMSSSVNEVIDSSKLEGFEKCVKKAIRSEKRTKTEL